MTGTGVSSWRAFARDDRGGATLELAIGAFVLVLAAALGFDLYVRIEADTTVARMAAAMSDYIARESVPVEADLEALGGFLHAHELPAPADLVYVLTAVRQPPGALQPALLWVHDGLRYGEPTVTAALATDCGQFGGDGTSPSLPATFPMGPQEEVLVIVEVCARLTREGSLTGRFVTGDVYRLHALPARDPHRPPARPA